MIKRILLICLIIGLVDQGFAIDRDRGQSPFKMTWWKVRARAKKIFFGKSTIKVYWNKNTWDNKRTKKKIDPLLNEYF